MSELRGFSAVTDNVLRRREYEAAHPAVTIRHIEQPAPWYWEAVWYDQGNRFRLTDDALGGLLDALDNLDLERA